MPMALEGVKVLDLASMWAAPLAAMHLADQGADVIKVEPPSGDDARRLFTHPSLGNESPSFLYVNRNKRGIVVDLRQEQGREIVRKLAVETDVLIHNFRPQVAQRLTFDYPSMERLNPRIIYVGITAYGSQGPFAARPGYDLVVQALSGMMHRSMPDGSPIGAGIWAADSSAPWLLAYGVTLALLERQRTGRGQQVESSLVHAAIAMQAVDLVKPAAESDGQRASANQAVFAPYRCSDDAWLLVVALSDKEWAKLCGAVGLDHLVEDPAFGSQTLRAEQSPQISGLLEGIFATRPRSEWLDILERHDVPSTAIVGRDEVYDHPQLTANEVFTSLTHPTAGATRMIGVPLKLSSNPSRPTTPSPLQGKHTDEVLQELGYRPGEIEGLRDAGVVG